MELVKILKELSQNLGPEAKQFIYNEIVSLEKNATALQLAPLLYKKANVNTTNSKGMTLLQDAVQNTNLLATHFLIQYGANINVVNNNHANVMHYSFYHSPPDLPLFLAISKGHLAMVIYLLHRGADIHAKNRSGRTPLHAAIAEGNNDKQAMEIAKYLICKGTDIESLYDKYTPLLTAHIRGKKELEICLIEEGANVHVKYDAYSYSDTYLSRVFDEGDVKLLKSIFFKNEGIVIDAKNKKGETLLHIAVKTRDLEFAKKLLGYGADVNQADLSGITPLHLFSQLKF